LGLISGSDPAAEVVDITAAPDLVIPVALHELTHALGRGNAGTKSIFGLVDFFSKDGTHGIQAGGRNMSGQSLPDLPTYFSIDGGIHKLADFGEFDDSSDWLNPPNSTLTPDDPFNEMAISPEVDFLTPVDLTYMDVLGFTVNPQTVVNAGNGKNMLDGS